MTSTDTIPVLCSAALVLLRLCHPWCVACNHWMFANTRISNSDWQTSAIQTALAHRRQQSATIADFSGSKGPMLTLTAGAASFPASSHAHTGQLPSSSAAAAAAATAPGSSDNGSGGGSGSGSASSNARSTKEQSTAAAGPAGHISGPAAASGSSSQVLQISERPGSAPVHAAQHVHMHLPLPLTPANIGQVRGNVAAVESLQHTSSSTSAVTAQRHMSAAASPSSTVNPAASSLKSAFAQPGPSNWSVNSSSPKGSHPKDVAFSSSLVAVTDSSSDAVQASSGEALKSQAKGKAGAPEEVVAEMVSTIAAESSSPLAGPGPEEPTLLIGEHICNPCGLLSVISGATPGFSGCSAVCVSCFTQLGQQKLVLCSTITSTGCVGCCLYCR